MSMSKKDYVNIANVLRAQYNVLPNKAGEAHKNPAFGMLELTINNMIDLFQRDNAQFDKQRWLDATIPTWDRVHWGLDPKPPVTIPRQRRA